MKEKLRKLTVDDLNKIRSILIDQIFRNEDVMLSDFRWSEDIPCFDSMIASLYNMLHFEVTGEEYYYFFHHANKIGAWTNDEYFDQFIGRITREEYDE